MSAKIMRRYCSGQIEQLSNGNWTHSKTVCEFPDKVGAQTDYRFCCEWEGVPSNDHTESDFQ